MRDVAVNSNINTKIILHVAQPKNVKWWFDNITTKSGVSNFDIIGFSYYSAYSNESIDDISADISDFKDKYVKEVMIVETAYPWTLESADNYINVLGQNALIEGYPDSKEGQLNYMEQLTQQVISGGGSGIMYWEPAWITSNIKTQYGTGSAWENNTFFDFNGKVHSGINYMTSDYDF